MVSPAHAQLGSSFLLFEAQHLSIIGGHRRNPWSLQLRGLAMPFCCAQASSISFLVKHVVGAHPLLSPLLK